MSTSLASESVHAQIDALLLEGGAKTAHEAESMFLDAHLAELARLIGELDDNAFKNHEAIKLLMAHGGRRREDALP